MFQSKEEITEAVNTLFDICSELERGDILSHETVDRVVQCPRHQRQWKQVIKRLRRRMLRERKITLGAEIEVGYKLLTKAEQINEGDRRTRRSIVQVRMGRNDLEALSGEPLSFHQRRLLNFKTEILRQTDADLTRQLRDMRAFAKPTPTLRTVPQ